MKIYIAAYNQNRLAGAETSRSVHSHICRLARNYPHMLESYHYMSDRILNAIRNNNNHPIFMDSGAFSAFTQGSVIDLTDYARFLKTHSDIIEVASNLDVIGRDEASARGTYTNQKKLEDLGATVCPVHHVRDADKWLVKYLEEGYDYIFLGGMVPETTQYLRKWLDHVWGNYLTYRDGENKGKARVKVHGFGLTTLELMFRYPWYSVDSTSWVMKSQFGGIYLDMPEPDGSVIDYGLMFSTKTGVKRDLNSWHWDRLAGPIRRDVLARLELLEAARYRDPELEKLLAEMAPEYKHGYNPRALSESYAWRDVFNIDYFHRAMNRRVDKFIPELTLGLETT